VTGQEFAGSGGPLDESQAEALKSIPKN